MHQETKVHKLNEDKDGQGIQRFEEKKNGKGIYH